MNILSENIEYIKSAFGQMQSDQDFGHLLNYANGLLYGEKAFCLPLDQFNNLSEFKIKSTHYTEFTIRKKSGDLRVIQAPSKNLKTIQKAMNVIFQTIWESHPAATGFLPGKTIVDNAKLHVSKNYVYNIDLKDFFSSISQYQVFKILQCPPFNLNNESSNLHLATLIANLCCNKFGANRQVNGQWIKIEKSVLPQGAPTSPILSNIICNKLDFHLAGLAKGFGLVYSRYADDITFSSSHNVYQKEGNFLRELNHIITNEGFQINERKTRLQKSEYKQEVTGLIVNEKVNVPCRYIKQLRMWLYLWEQYGYDRACRYFLPQYLKDKSNVKSKCPQMDKIIDGKLNYLKMIKGETNSAYKKLRERYVLLKSKLVEADAIDNRHSPDKNKFNLKYIVGSMINQMNPDGSFEDLIIKYIEIQGLESGKEVFNFLKEGWESNGKPKEDYAKIHNRLFSHPALNILAAFDLTEEQQQIVKQEGVAEKVANTNENGTEDRVVIEEAKGQPKITANRTLSYVYEDRITSNELPKLAALIRSQITMYTYEDVGIAEVDGVWKQVNGDFLNVSCRYTSDQLNKGQYVDSRPLLNPDAFLKGTELDIKVPPNFMDLLIPVYNPDGTKGKATTFGQYVAANKLMPSMQQYKDKIPMVVYKSQLNEILLEEISFIVEKREIELDNFINNNDHASFHFALVSLNKYSNSGYRLLLNEGTNIARLEGTLGGRGIIIKEVILTPEEVKQLKGINYFREQRKHKDFTKKVGIRIFNEIFHEINEKYDFEIEILKEEYQRRKLEGNNFIFEKALPIRDKEIVDLKDAHNAEIQLLDAYKKYGCTLEDVRSRFWDMMSEAASLQINIEKQYRNIYTDLSNKEINEIVEKGIKNGKHPEIKKAEEEYKEIRSIDKVLYEYLKKYDKNEKIEHLIISLKKAYDIESKKLEQKKIDFISDVENGTKGLAFIHDIQWYHPIRFDQSEPEKMAKAMAHTRAIRERVLNNKAEPTSITITEKKPTTFSPFKTKIIGQNANGKNMYEFLPYSDADPSVMFAIGDGGNKLYEDLTAKDKVFPDDNNIIRRTAPILGGSLYALRRVGWLEGKKLWNVVDVVPQHISLQVRQTVGSALNIYLNRMNKNPHIRSKHDPVIKQIIELTGYDLTNTTDIRAYLNQFINVSGGNDNFEKVGNRDEVSLIANRVIHKTDGKSLGYISITQSGTVYIGATKVNAFSFTTKEGKKVDVQTIFSNSNGIKGQDGELYFNQQSVTDIFKYLNARYVPNGEQKTTILETFRHNYSREANRHNKPVVFITANNEVIKQADSYKEYAKKTFNTNIRSINVAKEGQPPAYAHSAVMLSYDLTENIKEVYLTPSVESIVAVATEPIIVEETPVTLNENDIVAQLEEEAIAEAKRLGLDLDAPNWDDYE